MLVHVRSLLPLFPAWPSPRPLAATAGAAAPAVLAGRGPRSPATRRPATPTEHPCAACARRLASSLSSADWPRRRDRRRGSPGFSREIGLTRARIRASPPKRPRIPPRGWASTSYSTSFSSTPSSSRAASSASSIVRPVVSTHSIYRFRFLLLLLRRAARLWPCAARSALSCCRSAWPRPASTRAAPPAPACAAAPLAFPCRSGGRNSVPQAPSGLDRVPARGGSLCAWRGFGRVPSGSGDSTSSSGSAGASVTARFDGELFASIAPLGLPEMITRRDLAHDQLLLADPPEVRDQEVQDQTGREVQREDPEDDRKHLRRSSASGRWRPAACCADVCRDCRNPVRNTGPTRM